MPSISPQLQVGIFNNLYKSLSHVTIKPKDPELEVLTASFFLSLNDKRPLHQEVFQIGRDQYNKEDDLNHDINLAIHNVKTYLKEVITQTEHTAQSRQAVHTLINNLKMVGNHNSHFPPNTDESIKSWELFTDQICGALPGVDTILTALKTNIDSHAHLILSHKLRKQEAELNAELKQQEHAKGKARDREDEEKKAEISRVTTNVDVKGLIGRFTPKKPAKIIQPQGDAKRLADQKRAAEEKERKRLGDEERERKRLADEESERKRLADAERERLRLAEAERERLRLAEAEKEKLRLAEAERERLRLADEERERQRLAEAERLRLADAEQARLAGSKSSALPTMKQQPMSEVVANIPVINVNHTHQIDEILSAAKTLGNKKQLKEANKLFSHFHQQAILASDPVTRSLSLRKAMLDDWNNNLLPLQSQLLDRIAQLQVLNGALINAKEFINASSDPDLTHSVKKEYLTAMDKRISETKNALESYESTLEEFNNLEVGLANTNVTIYHDPEYEGQTNVAASVVRKILATEDRQAALAEIRNGLGIKIDERARDRNALELSTQSFEYERDKIDTTRDYTLLGFIGTDTESVNSPRGNVAAVRMESSLNTVYSMSADEHDRNNFTLQVIDLRDDLDPTHLMAKFVSNVNTKFGDLLPLFDNATPEKLYELFSQLPKKIPDIKTLENFLALNMQHSPNASPARVAKAMHKELFRVLRNEKNPEVPCIEALRLAKDAVAKVIESTDGKQTIIIHGQNAEMRRTMKYYCEMMIQHYKGFPDEQRKYDYFDGQDKFRPVLKSGFWGPVSSLFSFKDSEEKAVLKDLGLNKEGRRASKMLLRDGSEFDDQVRAKTTFAEELAAQKSSSKGLATLTNTLQTANAQASTSSFLQGAFDAAKSNARASQRLPEATTVHPRHS